MSHSSAPYGRRYSKYVQVRTIPGPAPPAGPSKANTLEYFKGVADIHQRWALPYAALLDAGEFHSSILRSEGSSTYRGPSSR